MAFIFKGSATLTSTAAYVGEDVIIRYNPRDMAELRVYFGDTFLCRAINPELAGETIGLKDIIRARNARTAVSCARRWPTARQPSRLYSKSAAVNCRWLLSR